MQFKISKSVYRLLIITILSFFIVISFAICKETYNLNNENVALAADGSVWDYNLYLGTAKSRIFQVEMNNTTTKTLGATNGILPQDGNITYSLETVLNSNSGANSIGVAHKTVYDNYVTTKMSSWDLKNDTFSGVDEQQGERKDIG
ncbi:MAG: hypothetical protein LBF12_06180 [Christensenellaceae bacterium]|jgi:hypothetical protein|nr:hypothetical protein [Christensenellaceae bacterium]